MFNKYKKLFAFILLTFTVKLVVTDGGRDVERLEDSVTTDSTPAADTTSADDVDDYDFGDDLSDDNNNNTISNKTHNNNSTTDDYGDYGELEGKDDECEESKGPTFLDKWMTVYEQGKDVPINKRVKNINETRNVMQVLKQNLEFLMKSNGNGDAKYKALEFFSGIDLGMSGMCLTAFTRVVMAIGNGELWALKFLDSLGRPLASGFAEGTQSNFGEYDECLTIVSPKSADNSRPDIKGQYCMLKAIMPFPSLDSLDESDAQSADESGVYSGLLSHYKLAKLATVRSFVEALNLSNGTLFRMGVCIPHACSAHEFQSLLNALLFPVTRIPLEVSPECHVRDQGQSKDKFQLISITFFTISTILMIVSTIYDVVVTREKYLDSTKVRGDNDQECDVDLKRYNGRENFFTCFSIIRNTRSLFAKNTKYPALDTMRLMLIIVVHMGHAYTYTTSLGLIGLKKIFSEVMHKVYEDNEYVFVRNPLIIDALLTLSGFLLSFCILKKLDKTKGHFNYVEFVFQRWIRFFTLMFGAILFFFVFPLTGDGPIWDKGVSWVTPGCQNPTNLIKMLLFVHNFRDDLKEQLTIANSKCNPPTWFLSTLFQLTLIGPIFIIVYHRRKLSGLIAIAGAILWSLLASIAPQLFFNLKPYLQIWELESVLFSVSKSYTWYHFTPNNYCTGFFVGIAYGYLMHAKDVRISSRNVTLFWSLTVMFCTGIYLWHNTFWRLDQSAPLISVLLWHSLGKLFFTVGFGWIYYACCTGRGGHFNRILSWDGFQPIARLSFGIYILHYLVVMHRIFSIRYTYVMSDKYMFEHLIVDIIYDVILAFIFYILIERPFFNVFALVFNRRNKDVEKDVMNEKNNYNRNQFNSFDKHVNSITNVNNNNNINSINSNECENNCRNSSNSFYDYNNQTKL